MFNLNKAFGDEGGTRSYWSTTYDTDENLTRDLDQIITKETLMGNRCKSIVEIGCGTGKNTLLLSQIAQTVYAVDFSASMIEKAKEKVNSVNVIFITADITKQWICTTSLLI
ncbi:MAG TPA: class I SAM-dependent methyltransferase [Nostoc sp.]|uniref:class I SAM-dependent methyltransferase n=1 Tax=Nostoc sp. TaxID=1180 RepID=UPI002D2809BC|nr:class I SAM-dependent methyltransferase [Nostoc sp.]HYX18940.1 class I SAM-dependent methyltransferase [Nostoc sp.]